MIGSIDHFVDRQIQLWQEERRIAERKGIQGKATQQPMVCVSRQYGARGAEMGRLVADQLHAAIHAAVEQVHDRLLVDRRLPPRALGKLQYARAAPGARHPARLRCCREHDQHLAFSPRADLRVAKAHAVRAPDAQRVGRQDFFCECL